MSEETDFVLIRVCMIFHRFSIVPLAEGGGAYLKNGFLFSALLRLRDGCTLRRRSKPSMFVHSLVRSPGQAARSNPILKFSF